MTPEKIAQELEIDYNVALEWRVYKEFTQKPEVIEYNPELPMYVWLDNSHWWEDPNAIVVMQPDWVYWNVINCLELQKTPEECAEFLSCQPKFVLTYSQEKFLNAYKTYNWRKALFVSDPYDTKSAMWNSTILDDYRKVGINLMLPWERKKVEQIQKTRSNIYRLRYDHKAVPFADAVMNSTYPVRRETSQATTLNILPVHNQFSHFRTALEYWVTYMLENPIIKKDRVVEDKRPVRDMRTWKLIYR